MFEALKGSYEVLRGLARTAEALERIASALERAIPPPPLEGEGEAEITYIDHEELAELEARQEIYWLETGVRLMPGQEPPRLS